MSVQKTIVECYPSLDRTVSPTDMDMQKAETQLGAASGLVVIFDTTVVPAAAPSLVLRIKGHDPISDKSWTILTSDPITAVGTVLFRVNPGAVQSNILSDGVLAKGTLTIDATATKFKTTTQLVYSIGGTVYTKAATGAIVFSANHVVTANLFGIILVQINGAGTIATKTPGATQTTAMAYASAPLALAALPLADTGYVAIGYIAIANNAVDWTANTHALTNGVDLTTATFVDATEQSLSPVNRLTVNDVLPFHWYVTVTAGNANHATYSVGAQLLP